MKSDPPRFDVEAETDPPRARSESLGQLVNARRDAADRVSCCHSSRLPLSCSPTDLDVRRADLPSEPRGGISDETRRSLPSTIPSYAQWVPSLPAPVTDELWPARELT